MGFSWQLAGTSKTIKREDQFNLDVTYYMNLAGEHAWKALFNISACMKILMKVLLALVLIFIGTSSSSFGRGTYGHYQIRHGYNSYPYGWVWNIHSDNWALYLQDSWTISDKLTVNFGVRAESEYIPSFDPNF